MLSGPADIIRGARRCPEVDRTKRQSQNGGGWGAVGVAALCARPAPAAREGGLGRAAGRWPGARCRSRGGGYPTLAPLVAVRWLGLGAGGKTPVILYGGALPRMVFTFVNWCLHLAITFVNRRITAVNPKPPQCSPAAGAPLPPGTRTGCPCHRRDPHRVSLCRRAPGCHWPACACRPRRGYGAGGGQGAGLGRPGAAKGHTGRGGGKGSRGGGGRGGLAGPAAGLHTTHTRPGRF